MASEIQATYGIDIPVTTNAKDAVEELGQLNDKIDSDTQALRQMQKALKDLQGGTAVSIDQFRSLRAQIAGKKQELAGATSRAVDLRAAVGKLSDAQVKAAASAKKLKDEQEKLAKEKQKEVASGMAHVLGILSPRLGHAARASQDFGQALKTIGASRALAVGTLALVSAAAIALVAAMAAVTIAVTAAAVALFKFGLAAADARRDERLMLQAASATLFWGKATAEAGQQAQLAVDNVAKTVPIARDQVAGFAAQLAKAQLKGQDLQKALRAVSVAASTGQDASGLIGAFSAIRFVGGSVDALAKRVEDRFGHVVKAQMLSLNVQLLKARENFGRLFAKVDPTPFLESLQKILSLFDTTTVTGWTLREVFGDLFRLLGFGAQSATPFLQKMFKLMVHGVLQATISVLQLIVAFKGVEDRVSKLTGGVGVLKAAWFAMGVALSPITVQFKAIWDFAQLLIEILPALANKALEVAEVINGVLKGKESAEGVHGMHIVDGWIEGLESRAGAWKDSIKNLAQAGLAAFDKVWKIHSPSVVAQERAHQIGRGFERGADDARGGVQSAAESMVQPPELQPAAAGGRADRGRGPVSVAVTFAPGAVQIHGGGDVDANKLANDLAGALEPKIAEIFEELAHQAGDDLEAQVV